MGLMTLLEFQTDLKDASGRASIDTSRLNRVINNAQIEFGYAFQFPELQGTSTIDAIQGINNYDLPANFRAMGESGVRISTPQERFGGLIAPESRTEFLRGNRYPMVDAQGAVGMYHMYAKKIWLRPTPDGIGTTIEYDYWKKITPLAVATDRTVFEDDWDDVLFRAALYRIHMVYGEHDRMINVFNMYLGLLRSRVMAEDLQEFPEGGISYIQSQFDNLRR